MKPHQSPESKALHSLTIESEVGVFKKTIMMFQYRGQELKAEFNRIFTSEEDQSAVFEYFVPLVSRLFNGINASVIGYGNTSSGKTHTMYGEKWPALISALVRCKGWESEHGAQMETFPGLILRLVDLIFKKIQEEKKKVIISVKYFQIYNEKIIDLMTVICDY